MSARKNTSIRLSDEERNGIAELAAKHGVKDSVIMQKAIRRFLSDYEREGPMLLVREDYTPSPEVARAAAIEAARPSKKPSRKSG
jgi:transposase-like protein